jgi:excisionase family DNA binding protein
VRTEYEPPVEALAYDVPVAGRMIGVGTTKVWELVRSGDLQTIRIGRRRLVTKEALQAFLDRLSASAA